MYGLKELFVDKDLVQGYTELNDHPVDDLHYKLQGEIRAGKMIFTDTCVEDEAEIASLFFPNLRSKTLLVGIWMGLDNLLRPISAPVVLSRNEMSSDELNRVVKEANISMVLAENHKIHYRKEKTTQLKDGN